MPGNLGRLRVTVKRGDEPFHSGLTELDFVLSDFWRWSVSDLVSNATRGRLAEFIVAKSLGISVGTVRDEWAAFDLLVMPEKFKVEVKSAAFIQSWAQGAFSRVSFVTTKTREWNAETNILSQESKRQADIYVFALLAEDDKDKIDPLDLAQWQFFVLPTCVLDGRTRSQHSITFKTLKKLTDGAVDYYHLPEAVRRAANMKTTDLIKALKQISAEVGDLASRVCLEDGRGGQWTDVSVRFVTPSDFAAAAINPEKPGVVISVADRPFGDNRQELSLGSLVDALGQFPENAEVFGMVYPEHPMPPRLANISKFQWKWLHGDGDPKRVLLFSARDPKGA